jgi:hypothetical protein
MADMVGSAGTAGFMANTANILVRYREADTSSAEVGRNSAGANRKNTAPGAAATGVAEIGVAAIGAAVGGIVVTDSSTSVALVIRTIGVGTLLGAGELRTRSTTAIILTGIIRRPGTIMIPIAPYQENDSSRPNPS